MWRRNYIARRHKVADRNQFTFTFYEGRPSGDVIISPFATRSPIVISLPLHFMKGDLVATYTWLGRFKSPLSRPSLYGQLKLQRRATKGRFNQIN